MPQILPYPTSTQKKVSFLVTLNFLSRLIHRAPRTTTSLIPRTPQHHSTPTPLKFVPYVKELMFKNRIIAKNPIWSSG